MQKNNIRVSIVIPAYNEHDHLRVCLQSIANQTIKPFEVIVVDNNSTDDTADIAKDFTFVTLLTAKQPRVVNARNTGFNNASGDVIGRIDADSKLSTNWVEYINESFTNTQIDAITGSISFYDMGLGNFVGHVDGFFRGWMSSKMKKNNDMFLLGANMAIRKKVWDDVKDRVCLDTSLHEDLDLAIHMSDEYSIKYDPKLKVGLSFRRINTSYRDIYLYCKLSPRAYFKHGRKSAKYIYPLIITVLLSFWILKFLYRGYDNDLSRMSLRSLFKPSEVRVSPVELNS